MTEALTRAVRGMMAGAGGANATVKSGVRAAILAFLSGEDVVEAMAKRACLARYQNADAAAAFAWTHGQDNMKTEARAALAALRALVQEDGK